ncbi:hypothetical protein FOPE_08451 [Fonsecaea pedrosoi]|nr:hypothetical protein FOPE_08451 [Fonsecaea pedrosoi]
METPSGPAVFSSAPKSTLGDEFSGDEPSGELVNSSTVEAEAMSTAKDQPGRVHQTRRPRSRKACVICNRRKAIHLLLGSRNLTQISSHHRPHQRRAWRTASNNTSAAQVNVSRPAPCRTQSYTHPTGLEHGDGDLNYQAQDLGSRSDIGIEDRDDVDDATDQPSTSTHTTCGGPDNQTSPSSYNATTWPQKARRRSTASMAAAASTPQAILTPTGGVVGRPVYLENEIEFLERETELMESSAPTSPPTNSRPEVDLAFLRLYRAFDLPTRAIRDSLVSSFTVYCSPWMPVIEAEELKSIGLGACEVQTRHSNQGENTVSLLLTQALFVAGSRVQSSRFSFNSCSEFYNRAKALYFAEHELNPLTVIRALCLLQWYNPNGPEFVSIHSSVSWLRLAVGLAFQIGLHREPDPRNPDYKLRRRLFWTLVARDALLSASQGRPRSINLNDCTVRWPTLHDFPEDNKHARLFLSYVDICCILGRLGQAALPGGHIGSLCVGVGRDLYRWRTQLPLDLQLDGASDFDFETRQLHIPYFTAISILYGPGPAVQNCSVAAILASSCVSRIFEDFLARDLLRYLSPIHIFYLFTAGLPQISGHKIPVLREASKREFKMIRYSLLEMSKTWHSAHRHLGSLNKLLSAMNRSSATGSFASKRNMALLGQNHRDSSLTDQLSLFERLGVDLCPKCDLVVRLTSPSFVPPAQKAVRSVDRDSLPHRTGTAVAAAVSSSSSSSNVGNAADVADADSIASTERGINRTDQGCERTYYPSDTFQLSPSTVPMWGECDEIRAIDMDGERHGSGQEPDSNGIDHSALTMLPPPTTATAVPEATSSYDLDSPEHRKPLPKQRESHFSSDHLGRYPSTYLHSNNDLDEAALTDKEAQRRLNSTVEVTARSHRSYVRTSSAAQVDIIHEPHGGVPSSATSHSHSHSHSYKGSATPGIPRSHTEIRRAQLQHQNQHHRQHGHSHLQDHEHEHHSDFSSSTIENHGGGGSSYTRIPLAATPTGDPLERNSVYHSANGSNGGGFFGIDMGGNDGFGGDEMALDAILLESDRSWVMQDWDSGYF